MPTRPVCHSSLTGTRSGHFSGFVPCWGTLTIATCVLSFGEPPLASAADPRIQQKSHKSAKPGH
jgi:hypothetical protein